MCDSRIVLADKNTNIFSKQVLKQPKSLNEINNAVLILYFGLMRFIVKIVMFWHIFQVERFTFPYVFGLNLREMLINLKLGYTRKVSLGLRAFGIMENQ